MTEPTVPGGPGTAADPRTHDLKTWPPYFDALADGSKTFEFREDDRGIQVGDVLRLREWDPTDSGIPRVYEPKGYTGREVSRRVTYVLRGRDAQDFGVQTGYCVLGLAAASGGAEPDDAAEDWNLVDNFPGWSDLTAEQKGTLADVLIDEFWRGFRYAEDRRAAPGGAEPATDPDVMTDEIADAIQRTAATIADTQAFLRGDTGEGDTP